MCDLKVAAVFRGFTQFLRLDVYDAGEFVTFVALVALVAQERCFSVCPPFRGFPNIEKTNHSVRHSWMRKWRLAEQERSSKLSRSKNVAIG